MLTTDLALRFDPAYEKISRRFYEHPEQFADAFARAWFKLTHRDMGPRARYLGPEVPSRSAHLARSGSRGRSSARRRERRRRAQEADRRFRTFGFAARLDRVGIGVHVPLLPINAAGPTARALRSSRKSSGPSTSPEQLATVLKTLEGIASTFNGAQSGGKKISLADLIVLAGNVGVEQAAKKAGFDVTVPFAPGRTDASQAQTDVESFEVLEPVADGFRNYVKRDPGIPAEMMLVDKAQLLNLTAPEMTVLIGGLRVLDTNADGSKHGVFTTRPGALTNDFFVNLLDMSGEWAESSKDKHVFERHNRKTGAVEWTGTRVDLIFGSNSELRALAEVYASSDAGRKFVDDFVAAWTKVMNADRFDLVK